MSRPKSIAFLTCSLLAAAAATTANAAVIIDDSPDALGSSQSQPLGWSNVTSQQNFLVQFSLGSTTTIGGMDIYSPVSVALGEAVTIKLRNDVSGSPDTTNFLSFGNTIDAIDGIGTSIDPSMSRLHVDFPAIVLGPGTYWIGMSGTNEIGWSSVLPEIVVASQWQLTGDALDFQPNIGPLAYRIDGVGVRAIDTPEPPALPLIATALLSIATLGAWRIKRNDTVG